MSEPTTPLTRKISVTFERKLDLGSYQNVVARAWVEDNVAIDAADYAVSEALSTCFGLAKAAVFDELGIEVLIDEAGVIREKHTPAVTRTETGGVAAARRELGATGGFDTKGIKVINEDDMVQDVPDDIAEYVKSNDLAGVWANNGKFGQFYKEYVPKDGTPKLGVDDKGRTKIIKV